MGGDVMVPCGGRGIARFVTRAVLLAVLSAAAAGCGSSNPYATVEISGKVTYEDGSLIQAEAIELVFSPQVQAVNAATSPRDARAVVNVADGTFTCATSYEYGDGVIPGKHKVAVQPLKDGAPLRGPVPAAYLNPLNTPLEITIEAGAAPLSLKVPKH
jgi:hypothetical protein